MQVVTFSELIILRNIMENPVNTAISGKKRRSPCGFLANTKTKKSMTMILFNIEITMNGVK